jgi:hypothetical protein
MDIYTFILRALRVLRGKFYKMQIPMLLNYSILSARGIIMRTTLELPEELIFKAMKITNIQTTSKVIITAPEELIRKNQLSELKNFKGKVDLEIDIDLLRRRNADFR